MEEVGFGSRFLYFLDRFRSLWLAITSVCEHFRHFRRKSRSDGMEWGWVWSLEVWEGCCLSGRMSVQMPSGWGHPGVWALCPVREDWVTYRKRCIMLHLALSSPPGLGEGSSTSQPSSTGQFNNVTGLGKGLSSQKTPPACASSSTANGDEPCAAPGYLWSPRDEGRQGLPISSEAGEH